MHEGEPGRGNKSITIPALPGILKYHILYKSNEQQRRHEKSEFPRERILGIRGSVGYRPEGHSLILFVRSLDTYEQTVVRCGRLIN